MRLLQCQKSIAYPVILKPAVMHHYFKKATKKAIIVKNTQELIENYQIMRSIIDPSEIMVQEIIPGRRVFYIHSVHYSRRETFRQDVLLNGAGKNPWIAEKAQHLPKVCIFRNWNSMVLFY